MIFATVDKKLFEPGKDNKSVVTYNGMSAGICSGGNGGGNCGAGACVCSNCNCKCVSGGSVLDAYKPSNL